MSGEVRSQKMVNKKERGKKKKNTKKQTKKKERKRKKKRKKEEVAEGRRVSGEREETECPSENGKDQAASIRN